MARQAATVIAILAAAAALAAGQARAGSTKVCVEVVVKGLDEEPSSAAGDAPPAVEADEDVDEVEEELEEPAPAKPAPALKIQKVEIGYGPHLPVGQTPERYLERLIEYYVTHEEGFEAVDEGCGETIRIEMYPLEVGWTVFARYSGNGREERVDQLFPHELSQFAERAVLALLGDDPIGATINKENVLEADSRKSLQKIKGKHHFALGVGAQIRGGWIDTVVTEGEGSGGVEPKIRVMSPMLAMLGYRGEFESWGLEAMAHIAFGTQSTAAHKNPEGGHIDFGGDAALVFHVFRYNDPRGVLSFYYGAGATFELLWFTAIRREESRALHLRRALLSGGLDVDFVLGWEFMRASSVQFHLQGEVNAPVYVIQSENRHGSMETWFPGVTLELGVVF